MWNVLIHGIWIVILWYTHTSTGLTTGKEAMYCRPQQLAPERGWGGYTNRGGHTRSHSSESLEDWIPHEGPSPDELREEVFAIMNKQSDTLGAQVEALLMGDQTCRYKGCQTWSSSDCDDDTSLQQCEEQSKRCKVPPSHDIRECNTHFERNTSWGRIPGQQEG